MRATTEPVGTVLLVGDTEGRDTVESHLSASTLDLDAVPDLLDALDRLESHEYDGLVLTDTQCSPATAVDRIRRTGHTVPVVALVGDDGPAIVGVDAVAPLDEPDAVVSTVEETVDAHRFERQRIERGRLCEAIERAGDAALEATDTTHAFDAVCRELVAAGTYDIAWVGRHDAATERLEPVAAAGIPLSHLGGVPVGADAETTASWAIETGAVAVDTDDDEPRTLAVPLGDPPEAVLLVGGRGASVPRGERHALSGLSETLQQLFDGPADDDESKVTVLGDALAHELGNHLDIALTHLELARERGDESHFENVESALDRMTDVAANARLLADGDPALEQVDVADAAASAWAVVESNGAALEVDSVVVEADPDLLGLLLENLLRNAVEHGGDEVRVRVGPTDDGFAVADDGPGIPPEDRERVLEWGYTTGGTGVGLGIVALVAERHGWTVEVTESQVGGARFEFS